TDKLLLGSDSYCYLYNYNTNDIYNEIMIKNNTFGIKKLTNYLIENFDIKDVNLKLEEYLIGEL
ncbi:MAG: hypothetical protein H7836_17905, partial [Magnetococcus sp. YQC-3]